MFNVDGSIHKFKSRLVAKEYSQKEGIYYGEKCVHVAKMNTIRLMIGLATKYNWKLHQLDVNSTFLNGSKWLFKSMFNVDGSIHKFKSRLVAKEYSQKEGIYYGEKCVHVAKMNIIRLMIGLATKYNWKLHQLDVNSTFLNGSKWLFKSMFNVDGSIHKFKSRLVAKEYSQKEGIYYGEKCIHVAKMNTIRLMIGLATKYNWKLHQLDVNSTFLNGELKEEVYIF
jgi:phage baseplate assembly protein gpV